ncbi:MAG: hypothetical protein R2762_17775 [Bryobacteraceae bacterium]
MKLTLAVLLTASLFAADPEGFVLWPKGVPPAGAKAAKFSNHQLSVSHREKDGIPEVHEGQTDIFVIQSGEGVLLVGGEVVGGKTTTPGEIRGGTIKNGVRKKVSAGDVVHIPARTPHQFFVAQGKEVTYFVVKVDAH